MAYRVGGGPSTTVKVGFSSTRQFDSVKRHSTQQAISNLVGKCLPGATSTFFPKARNG